MSFTVKCPKCGHYLGSGHIGPHYDDNTKESLNLSLGVVEIDPAQTVVTQENVRKAKGHSDAQKATE